MTAKLPDAHQMAAALHQLLERAGGSFEFHTEPTDRDREMLPIVEPSSKPGHMTLRMVSLSDLPPELSMELLDLMLQQIQQRARANPGTDADRRRRERMAMLDRGRYRDPYGPDYPGDYEAPQRPSIRFDDDNDRVRLGKGYTHVPAPEPEKAAEPKTDAPHLVGGKRDIDVEPKRLT